MLSKNDAPQGFSLMKHFYYVCCGTTHCYIADTTLHIMQLSHHRWTLQLEALPCLRWVAVHCLARHSHYLPSEGQLGHTGRSAGELSTAGMCWRTWHARHRPTSIDWVLHHDLHTRLTCHWWKMTICEVSLGERSQIGRERTDKLLWELHVTMKTGEWRISHGESSLL